VRVEGASQVGQSLQRAVCCLPQLTQPAGEEEQQPGVALRLPLLGQVGFGQRGFEWEWLREQSGHTGSAVGQRGTRCPKRHQFLHWG